MTNTPEYHNPSNAPEAVPTAAQHPMQAAAQHPMQAAAEHPMQAAAQYPDPAAAQYPQQAAAATAPRPRLNWAIIIGLGAMSLAWPLTGLLGFDGAVRAWTILAATIVIWLGVVGLGRVPRPVLTLTLAGLAYGIFHLIVTIAIQPLAIFSFWTITPLAGVGALLGLAAAGIQRMMGPRR